MPNLGEASGSSASRMCAFDPVMLEQHIKQHAMHSQTLFCMLILFLGAVHVKTRTPPKKYPENAMPTTSILRLPAQSSTTTSQIRLTGPPRRHLTQSASIAFYPCPCSSRLSRASCKSTGEPGRRPTMIHLLPLRLVIPVPAM